MRDVAPPLRPVSSGVVRKARDLPHQQRDVAFHIPHSSGLVFKRQPALPFYYAGRIGSKVDDLRLRGVYAGGEKLNDKEKEEIYESV